MFQTTNQNISHELLVANYLPAGLPSQSASPSSNIPVESFIGLELAEAIRNRTRHRRLFHGFLPVFSRTSPCFPCFLYLVGGIPTPLKNMSSSMGRMTSHILSHIWNGKQNSCFKQPTSYVFPVRFLHQRFPRTFSAPQKIAQVSKCPMIPAAASASISSRAWDVPDHRLPRAARFFTHQIPGFVWSAHKSWSCLTKK